MLPDHLTTGTHVALDFGISNTDVVAAVNGELHYWHQPYKGDPDAALIRDILAVQGIELSQLERLTVTGGRHKLLPAEMDGCPVVSIGEMEAIGRGGQVLAIRAGLTADTPIMVVSAGSGTAVLFAHNNTYRHVTGTAVGGGTMLGLARLLVGTTNPQEIDDLALQGSANHVDLTLGDVITGEVGNLPVDATAVHFGRIARGDTTPTPADYAAAIPSMVAQTIALIATAAAPGAGASHVVITGHMGDMASIRHIAKLVGHFYHTPIIVPDYAGYATALGALFSPPSHLT